MSTPGDFMSCLSPFVSTVFVASFRVVSRLSRRFSVISSSHLLLGLPFFSFFFHLSLQNHFFQAVISSQNVSAILKFTSLNDIEECDTVFDLKPHHSFFGTL